MVRNVFRRNRMAVGGFVVARAAGTMKGRTAELTGKVTFKPDQEYWMNAIIPATIARMIAQGNGVRPGVHFLFDAVDPAMLITGLHKSGVTFAQEWS